MSSSPSSVQATTGSVSGQSTPSSSAQPTPSSSSQEPTPSSAPSSQPAASFSSVEPTYFYSSFWPGAVQSTRPFYPGQPPSSYTSAQPTHFYSAAYPWSGQLAPAPRAGQPATSSSVQPAASASSAHSMPSFSSMPAGSGCPGPTTPSIRVQLVNSAADRQSGNSLRPSSPSQSIDASASNWDGLPRSFRNLPQTGPNAATPGARDAYWRQKREAEESINLEAKRLVRWFKASSASPSAASPAAASSSSSAAAAAASSASPPPPSSATSARGRRDRPHSRFYDTWQLSNALSAPPAPPPPVQAPRERKLGDWQTPVYVLESVPATLPPPPPPPGAADKHGWPILWVPGRDADEQPFYKYRPRESASQPHVATPRIKTGYWRPARFGKVDCYCWVNVGQRLDESRPPPTPLPGRSAAAVTRAEEEYRRIARLHACAAPATGYCAFCEHVARPRHGNDASGSSEAADARSSDGAEEASAQNSDDVKEDKKSKGKEKV